MEYMFYRCNKFQSLDLSNFDTSKVENMAYIFYGCTQLQSLDLSNFYTPLLQNSESMFEGCIQILSIRLSNFKSSIINSMNNMFKGCRSLKYLDINNCNDSPSFISSMFENVNNLQYINIYNISSNGNLARIISTELNNIDNLFVCQKNGIITNPQDTYVCCDFNITISKCQPSNYITLFFNKESHYENGFKNEFRYDITFLDYNDKTIASNTELNILAGTHLQVCFNYPIINMTNFFSEKYDNNIINVISIDFSYFNSSLVKNMANMFFGCSTLELINFLNFDTFQVSNMFNMFFNCASLRSINVSSFNIINVENMNSMFSGCISLESLNLSNFNVIKVKDMANMFSGCSSLKSINLSNFLTDNLENMNSMFSQCISIESIILFTFNTIKVKDMAKIFEGCRALKSIDLSNFETTNAENMNSMFSQCTALESLNLSNFDTSAVKSMDYMFYNCSSLRILDIANFNLLQSTINQIFFGLTNLSYINIYNIKDNNKIVSSTLNTDTNKEKIFYVCQQEFLITNIKSLDCCNYYENEAHCDFNISDNRAITKEIMNAYNNILITLEEKDYKVIKTENMVLQFSTYYEQLTNISEIVSSIDLGECEDKLREQEGLNETENLLMIKLDIKNKTTNAIIVQYEIFNPRNYSKVSLDVCKNITIKKKVPVILDQEKLSLIDHLEQYGYNPFDITDDFYNDVCSLYTAQNGADMVLSSRKTRIYDTVKDFYLCEEGCEFDKFDTNMSKAECYCNIQTNETVTDVSKISFDKSEFVNNFYSTLYNSNFRVLKCIKLLFSSKGIKSNYGCYIMTFLLVSFIVFVIIHIKIGQTRIINIINNIMKSKGISENYNDIKDKKEEMEKEIKEEILQNNMDKPETNDDLNIDIKIEDLQAPVKKRNLNKFKPKDEPIEKKDKIIYNTTDEIDNKVNEKDDKIEDKNEKIIKNNNNDKNENSANEQFRDLTDVEKNELDYEDAIVYDKRSLWQYYVSQLKRGHLIIFTFITKDDYNLRQIKILLFIVSFALYFTINAFFFGDDTMDQIYEDNAIFNFLFQLPQILYSSIISSIIDIILKKLTISEEKILQMKKEKDMDKFIQKSNKIKNSLKLKLIIFLALSSILILFFWYFISCFCAVYGNTQHILIEDTFISFGTSMLYPFGLKIIPAIFRIPALRAPKKDKKYLYKISLLLNKFL
jgi:surface protein